MPDPTRDRLLTPERRVILRIVAAAPGAPLGLVRARAGLSWSSVYHHVAVLEDAGRLTRRKEGRRQCLYLRVPTGREVEPPARALLAGPRGRTARLVARLVLREPGIRVDALARLLGIPRRSAYHNVRRLAQAGLLARPDAGRGGVAPTPLLHAALPPAPHEEPPARPASVVQGMLQSERPCATTSGG